MAAHAHHHHNEPEGVALTQAAQTALEKAGEQWTTMRASVFEALAGFEKPASAYDIAEAVSRTQGRRVAANTVYRILDLFVGSNLARKVESANAYVANAHPDCLHDCISWSATNADRRRISTTIASPSPCVRPRPERAFRRCVR